MRRAFHLLAWAAAAITLVVGGVGVADLLTAPVDHRPLRRPSALDASPAPSAGECTPTLPRRLIVVGWDSADWDLILPLLDHGELPNLATLMAEGTSGTLATFLPSISPALWTTVATGVDPQRHGIQGFYAKKPRLARWWSRIRNFGELERKLFSSSDRRVRAIWNLLSDADRKVLVVGYHNTFPVEEVDGAMVSNYLTQESIGRMMDIGVGANPELANNLVHPVGLLDRVLTIQREVDNTLHEAARRFSDAGPEEVEDLLARGRELPADGDRRPWFLLHSYSYDEINARIAEALYPLIEPDALFVHFQSADWAAHQFLAFDRPDAFVEQEWSDATRERLASLEPLYRETVREFYRYLDDWLGRLLALRGPETAVIILSDHGTGAGDDPDIPGNHDHGPPGMILLSGPGIRSGTRIEGATLYDLLPTMAALLGLPLARDLPGRVLDQAFCPGAWSPSAQPMVDSYTPEALFRPPAARPEGLDEKLLEQLEALGYVDE